MRPCWPQWLLFGTRRPFPPPRWNQAVTPDPLESRHSGLALGLRGDLGHEPSNLLARGSSLVPPPSRWARRQYVRSLTERCRSRQVRLPQHLRPTSRRRRAGATEATANPGPWSCGATDSSLWGPCWASSSFQLIQTNGDQVHAGHTHTAAHTSSTPTTSPYLSPL